jgi:hypothetical protein
MNNSLIFIWIGKKIPSWILDSLEINTKTSKTKIILLRNYDAKYEGSIENYSIEEFYDSKLLKLNNRKFRNGFEYKTMERFYILYEFMIKYNINKVFHAELDNIVFDISKLSYCLDQQGKGLFCPRDSSDRGIASLIYINEINALKYFCTESKQKKLTDMENLGLYLNERNDIFHSLPTDLIINNNNLSCISYRKIFGIFDAASIGQYILGIDPRNIVGPLTNGFINENANKKIDSFIYIFDLNKGELRINYNNLNYNVYNLHVHSKLFKLILNKNKFKKIIDRINNKKKSLLKINFFNSLLRLIELVNIKINKKHE